MDVFCILEVHIGKEVLHSVILFEDRHRSYIVAFQKRKKALLATQVAVVTVCHWLTIFGVPCTICSEHGSQFTGGWFKAMCSLMGI